MTLPRRDFLHLASGALAGLGAGVPFPVPRVPRPLPPGRPRPTAAQLAWQRDEWAMFIHFGVNTFSDREWGDGREDPASFTPAALDARQWARAARAAGFRAMILTAKHHDGFCLWPTATTRHGVVSSPFRGGQGDVVREFVDACRAEGLRPGLYLSPWDRNAAVYGDSPRYNDFYCDQLTELLTRYGPLAEVWFDGANGEGPNGRRQVYDWPRVFGLVRRLQPEAVMFSDAGPDVRWIGNETGSAGDPNWSTVDPAAVPYPGAEGERVIAMLQHGDPAGSIWRPGETDVSIRPGWFHHPAEDARVKSVAALEAIHCTSVGRNSKLLLNVPPTREGLLHQTDVARLTALRARIDGLFAEDLAQHASRRWTATGPTTGRLELELPRPVTANLVALGEAIELGQCVARYRLEGSPDGRVWTPLAAGQTIGYRKLDRCPPTQVRRVRLSIDEGLDQPRITQLALFHDVSA
ncbi:MAG: alpha-L-fucosidase [Gemmatimonadales bacterium]|nr:alpha-L-fucosidase [Gemmatimonadales bacterium]